MQGFRSGLREVLLGVLLALVAVYALKEAGIIYVGLYGPGIVPENGVMVLEDGEYLEAVRSIIASSKEKVYVVMYVAKYDPNEHDDPANILLESLVSAASRGVTVRVVVDDVTNRSYPQTIDYLERHGVEVRLDESSGRTTHSKIVVVDGRYVIIGSHNWTESALSRNHEVSLLINSPSIAGQVESYIDGIWSNGRTP